MSNTLTKALIGKEDLKFADDEFFPTDTFTRLNYLGGNNTMTKMPDLWKIHYPVINARYYGGSTGALTQATITSALGNIGAVNKRTLVLEPGMWVISSNVDWSAYTNVTFRVMPGAIISHGAFTVNIPNLVAGLYPLFSGTGAVTLSGNVACAYPQWWGGIPIAAASQSSDHTSAIHNMLNCGAKRGFISAGYWMVDADAIQTGQVKAGLNLPSNYSLELMAGAYLQALNMNNDNSYNILCIYNKSNVVIHGAGAKLIGDSANAANKPGVAFDGIGLRIMGATNVWVYDLTATKAWADGFTIGYDDVNSPYPESVNVNLVNCIGTDNYRLGASVVGVIGGGIWGGSYDNNSGTSPQSGIDVEPNDDKGGGSAAEVREFTVSGPILYSNTARGLQVLSTGGLIHSNTFVNIKSYANGEEGIAVVSDAVSQIYDNIFKGNIARSNSQTTDNTDDNIYIYQCENNLFEGNITRQGSSANKPRWGIYNNTTTGTNIFANNDTRSGGKTGNFKNNVAGGSFLSGIVRRSFLLIDNGSVGPTIMPTLTSDVDGDAIGATDNVGKGATTGHYTLSANGSQLTIINETGGLTYTVYRASAELALNSTTVDVSVDCSGVTGNIVLSFFKTSNGTAADLTTLVAGGGLIEVYITYTLAI